MSDLQLFEDDTDDTDDIEGIEDIDPNNPLWLRKRLNLQWLFTVAWRDGLSTAYRRPIKYSQVLASGDKYAPEILGRQQLLFEPGESKEARYYRAVAQIRQQEINPTDVHISPVDIIDEDIQKQKDLLQKSGIDQSQIVLKKLNDHLEVRKEFEEQERVYVYERDALLHDWVRGIDLPTFFPLNDQHYSYHDFALPGQRVMRVRFVHETKAETMTGVDFIYECHRPNDRIARLVAVQYKLPQGNNQDVFIGSKIQSQLDRMCTVFCNNELCDGPHYDSQPMDNRPYQLPNCCAFFRPTDRLQKFDSRLASTGCHIRRCDIDRVCEFKDVYSKKTKTMNKMKAITPAISTRYGLNHTIFEDLFNTERLGSRWLTYEQLEKFHKNYEVTKPSEHAGIYIQEAPEPVEATLF